jgi:hypothetical protein
LLAHNVTNRFPLLVGEQMKKGAKLENCLLTHAGSPYGCTGIHSMLVQKIPEPWQ